MIIINIKKEKSRPMCTHLPLTASSLPESAVFFSSSLPPPLKFIHRHCVVGMRHRLMMHLRRDRVWIKRLRRYKWRSRNCWHRNNCRSCSRWHACAARWAAQTRQLYQHVHLGPELIRAAARHRSLAVF